jgi:hypothetical protein
MALQKLTYRPGLNREGTNYSNEGGFFDGDKVRFRSGQAEKIGGWVQVDVDQFQGYAKSLWTWTDIDGLSSYLSLGTNIKYYIFFGGVYYDITPIYRVDGTTLSSPYSLSANPISTTNGSSTVTITDGNYNPSVGDYVIITSTAYTTPQTATITIASPGVLTVPTTALPNGTTVTLSTTGALPTGLTAGTLYYVVGTSALTFRLSLTQGGTAINTSGTQSGTHTVTPIATVGGLSINGEYVVSAAPTSTTYEITAASSATSTATGGGVVTLQYQYPIGASAAIPGLGWGAGTWSPTIPFNLTTNPFAATSGSSTITVTQAAHGLSAGNYVSFVGPASNIPSESIPAFAGIPINNLKSTFVVQTAATNTYTINLPEQLAGSFTIGITYTIATAGTTSFTAIGAANNNPGTVFTATGRGSGTGTAYITATSTASGGGAGVVAYPQYGSRGWSTAAAAGQGIAGTIRLWSNDNYGSDLVISPRAGPIFYWQDSSGVSVRAQSLANLANAATLTTSTATFGSGVATITVSDATSILPYSYITGTGIAAGTYVTSAYIIGSTSVPISANTTGANDANPYTFSYAGSYVPTSTNQIMTASIEQFIIALGSNSYFQANPSSPFNPMLVRWSDQANPYQWVPQVTNQSGEFTLTNGSFIMCGQSTRQETLIWTDSCLYSMQYVGFPYVWSFQVLMDNISIISPNAPVTVNNVTYWMGKDKFYSYTGVVQTLPCSLRQYIFDNINRDQAFQIFGGSNEAYNEVWWFYCSQNSTVIDKYVIYNYLDKVWSYGTMGRTAWLQYGINPYPVAADYNSRLLYHEVGCDDVSTASPQPINAYIQSSDFGIEAGEHLGFVWRMLPDVNFTGSTTNNPSVTMTLFGKANSGSYPVASDVDTVTSGQNYTSVSEYTIQTYDGQIYTRLRGRQLSFKIESTTLGVAWQLGIPRIDVKPAGRR